MAPAQYRNHLFANALFFFLISLTRVPVHIITWLVLFHLKAYLSRVYLETELSAEMKVVKIGPFFQSSPFIAKR